jgi:predicted GNAT family acetyltransferase
MSESGSVLDNPIWNALTTRHSQFAHGDGLARRYDREIGPLCGMADQSPEAYRDLAAIISPGELAILFLTEAAKPTEDFKLVREGELVQMVCAEPPAASALESEIHPLEPADLPEMLALTKLTEPGPFRSRTADLGGFVGIRIGGRLAAMAGMRVAPPGYREVSAVCTHPDFRGRGLALALVATVSRNIHAMGEVPYLTSYAANANAIRVYEAAGFAARGRFDLAVLTPAGGEVPTGLY